MNILNTIIWCQIRASHQVEQQHESDDQNGENQAKLPLPTPWTDQNKFGLSRSKDITTSCGQIPNLQRLIKNS